MDQPRRCSSVSVYIFSVVEDEDNLHCRKLGRFEQDGVQHLGEPQHCLSSPQSALPTQVGCRALNTNRGLIPRPRKLGSYVQSVCTNIHSILVQSIPSAYYCPQQLNHTLN